MAAAAAAPSPPGFIVWGLFASFGALVAGYAVWMFWVERREDSVQDRASESAR